MGSSHNFTDNVIRELPMEIQMAFYPPPNIRMPDLNIPSLRRYEYKFDRERAAILRYEEEQTRRKLRHEEEEAKSAEKTELNQIEEPTITTAEPSMNSREGPTTSTLQPEPMSLPVLPHQSMAQPIQPLPSQPNSCFSSSFPNLNGTGISGAPSSSFPHSSSTSKLAHQNLLTTTTAHKTTTLLNDFAEFEAKRDPFELVELRSLDDRGELEKLLMGMQMNTTAANGHQQG